MIITECNFSHEDLSEQAQSSLDKSIEPDCSDRMKSRLVGIKEQKRKT